MPLAAPAAVDPHAGHTMQAVPAADPHAGHRMEAAVLPPPVAPPPAAALQGPAHAADTLFDPAAMAAARAENRRMHGMMPIHRFVVDRFEVALGDGPAGYAWEGVDFWYGGDIDKLWLKGRGEGSFGGGVEEAEVQALWSHAIGPFWDLQAGLRYDIRPRPGRGQLVLGVQGLAPHWFEVDAAAFLSEQGDVTARIEAEYDLRITQRLILQPAAEIDLSLQDVPAIGLGSGLTGAEAGLRLRYEIVPEFAPYVGLRYERAFGDTARFRRASGEDVGGWRFLLGVRTWF
jgi:copper resistance protein B